MSEEAQEEQEVQEQTKTFTEDDVKALLEKETEGLKRKVDELLGEKKTAAQKAKEAEEEAKRITEEAARKSGDVEALENSWKEKLTKREQELQAEIERMTGALEQTTVKGTATAMAAELAVEGSAKALLPHIQGRLRMEIKDGQPATVVLDVNGKPSAMTVDELKQEIANDAAFAPLIAGSKASGGGASGAKGGQNGGAEMTTTEKHKLYRDNPEQYRRLFGA